MQPAELATAPVGDGPAAAGPASGGPQRLEATPTTCTWGYIDPGREPAVVVGLGERLRVDVLTHRAGDAPDLLMDERARAVHEQIPPEARGPGSHLVIGPVFIEGVQPGDVVAVDLLDLVPTGTHGSNYAAPWGLLRDVVPEELVTVYELDAAGAHRVRPVLQVEPAVPISSRPPGAVVAPEAGTRRRAPRSPWVAARPHLGITGLLPAGTARRSSREPGPFGGNLDNWRFGPGSTLHIRANHPGGGVFFGDAHLSQGDGELCGTAVEASCTAEVRFRVVPPLDAVNPVLETPTHWYTHGFAADLDSAVRVAAAELLGLLCRVGGLDARLAYSLLSVAGDLGITQVVNGVVGCHAGFPKAALPGPCP